MKFNTFFPVRQTTVIFKITVVLAALLILCAHAHAQKSALLWATYYGGDTATSSGSAGSDKFGNVYISGCTFNAFGMATEGAYQTMGDSINGDAYLAKFSPNGNLLWATYFGGKGFAEVIIVVIDSSGNVYCTGNTSNNSGIATKGAYQTSYGGGISDAFLAKFSPSGNLLWATYFGGQNEDWGTGLSLDKYGNIYISGTTLSLNNIATSSAYQTLGDSAYGDAFLAKFSSSGSLLWGTYYGGNYGSQGFDLVVDTSNYIYISGFTFSTSGIATNGVYQTSFGGGANDAFLAKFSPIGSLLWCTYYGGNGDENDVSTVIDNHGNVFLVGETNSTSGIATNGVYQTSFGGGTYDAFLAKFNPSGGLLWGTYYGGNGDDDCGWIMTSDAFGNIYMPGFTNSTSGIATLGAYQVSNAGGYDAFLAKFDPSGSLLWGTYYGGKGNDYGNGSAIDGSGNVYLSGGTFSISGIATSGAYKTVGNSNYGDAFLAKFSFKMYQIDAGMPYIINPIRNFCTGTQPIEVPLVNYGKDTLKSVKIGWTINGMTQTTYNWTGNLKTDSETTITLGNYNFTPGTYNIVAWVSLPNGVVDSFPANDTAKIFDTVSSLPLAITGNNQSICLGDSAGIGGSAVPGNTYFWVSMPAGYISDSATTRVAPTITTTFYLTETTPSGGCSKSDSVIITVNLPPTINAGKDTSICTGSTTSIGMTAAHGDTYSWVSNPSGYTSTLSNPIVSPTATTTYILNETTTSTGCKNADSIVITVNPLPIVNAGRDTSICEGATINIGMAKTNGNTYSWTSQPTGYTSTLSNSSISPTATTTYTLTETITATGCKNADTVIITVNPLPIAPTITPSGDTLASSAKTGNQWLRNDTVINGASSQKYIALVNGNYSVMVTDSNGCSAASKPLNYTMTGIIGASNNFGLKIYPNPFNSQTTIEATLNENTPVSVAIYDMTGRQITAENNISHPPGQFIYTFDAEKYRCGSGVYIVKLAIGDAVVQREIVLIR